MNLSDKIRNEYRRWLDEAVWDEDIIQELKQIENCNDKISDAFYKKLEFGTGGLRGIIGAGTNRMNVYTVANATQGYAEYLLHHVREQERKVAISYDSRLKSQLFAKMVAEVLAANRIKVYLYSELMPTPCLSFAVRKLQCAGGIMITASHNPAEYNGYKVYGANGGQITDDAAADILAEINALDVLNGANRISFDSGIAKGWIEHIGKDVETAYIESIKALSLRNDEDTCRENAGSIKIVYSPLNGTGLKPVMRCLTECGFKDVTVVKEQEEPDGHFPTCPYPNPEAPAAMELGIKYAQEVDADVFLATDPDCDRVGVAVKNDKDEFVLLSGNETGVLLFDYVCSRRKSMGTMPERPIMVKSIVTTDMAEVVARDYGVETVNVLTGFKYIGEQIGRLEECGEKERFIWGFEESCGYLSGTHARDKDAVNGVLLICEMVKYYKGQGSSLMGRMAQLEEKYGHWVNETHSIELEGEAGKREIARIMEMVRAGIDEIGGDKVVECVDYIDGVGGLPKANVVKLVLETGGSVIVRPSGTEPKVKVYVSGMGSNQKNAEATEILRKVFF